MTETSDREALGAALILLDRTERALRATIAERDGWQRDAAAHAARATGIGYRLNGALRERDRLAVRLAEVERERDALESLHDEWAAAIRKARG